MSENQDTDAAVSLVDGDKSDMPSVNRSSLQMQNPPNDAPIETSIDNRELHGLKQPPYVHPSPRRWTILVACSISTLIFGGFPFNMAVLYDELLDTFGKSSSATALVIAFSYGMFAISGVVFGVLVNQYGARQAGVPAALLASVGIGMAAFATDIQFLTVTAGAVCGVGTSGMYIASVSSIAAHFDGKSKLLALPMYSLSAGIGSMIRAQLMNFLSEKYGWRGCLLIWSGFCLNSVPSLCICTPRGLMKNAMKLHVNIETLESSTLDIIKALVKNKIYILVVFAYCLNFAGINGILVPFVNFVKSKGFTKDEAVWMIFILESVGSFQVLAGLCKQLPKVSILFITTVLTFGMTVSLFGFPHAASYRELIAVTCVFGFCRGGMIGSLSLTTMKIVRPDHYPTAFGILSTFIGIHSIAFPPLQGYFRDTTGSYDLPCFVSGAIMGCSCLLFALALFIRKSNGLDNVTI